VLVVPEPERQFLKVKRRRNDVQLPSRENAALACRVPMRAKDLILSNGGCRRAKGVVSSTDTGAARRAVNRGLTPGRSPDGERQGDALSADDPRVGIGPQILQ